MRVAAGIATLAVLAALWLGAAWALWRTQVPGDLRLGARRLLATPAAVGSIVSVSLDQFLVGLVTVFKCTQFGCTKGTWRHYENGHELSDGWPTGAGGIK